MYKDRVVMPNTTTIRMYRFDQCGGPENLKLETVPLPEPWHGEARVKVQAMRLNRADLLWLANTYIETPRPPARLGYEVARVVESDVNIAT
jgi:NADPH:quinone reductase-like Zn-dependent oxidoreductase